MTLEQEAVAELKSRKLTLITVESCTGGLLAHRITLVPGASEVFWGGLITYDNSAKELLAHVPRELMIQHGAVSREVAQALAEGGIAAGSPASSSSRCVCISTTGIAGPGGGTPQKPVGLCYVGITISGKPSLTLEIRAKAGKSREEYKIEFSDRALSYLVQELRGE